MSVKRAKQKTRTFKRRLLHFTTDLKFELSGCRFKTEKHIQLQGRILHFTAGSYIEVLTDRALICNLSIEAKTNKKFLEEPVNMWLKDLEEIK